MKNISKYKLPDWFIHTFIYFLNINFLLERNTIPDDLIKKYSELINWDIVVLHSKWDVVKLKAYIKYLNSDNLRTLFDNMYIPLEFITNHISNMNMPSMPMDLLCASRVITKDFVREHLSIIDWDAISSNGEFVFDYDFIIEFIDKLNLEVLMYTTIIPMNIVVKYPERFNLYLYYLIISGSDKYDIGQVRTFQQHFKLQIQKEFLKLMNKL